LKYLVRGGGLEPPSLSENTQVIDSAYYDTY
jgi:hypothetical protein